MCSADIKFGSEGLEDFEESSCNAAAGVSSGGDTANPQPLGVQEGPARRARMFVQ